MLTLALATYDDFDGAIFTIQHAKTLADWKKENSIVLVNNNPNGEYTGLLKQFCASSGVIYVEEFINSTSISRQRAIENSPTDIVVVVDSHVIIMPGSFQAIEEYFSNDDNQKDIVHGILLDEKLEHGSGDWLDFWREENQGIWNPSFSIPDKPIEILGTGLGLFAINKRFWPGFHPLHRGFGGEELYIHEKIRRNGGKVVIHPEVKYWHRFFRKSVPYPLSKRDKIRNYILHYLDIGWPLERIKTHFVYGQSEVAPWGEVLKGALSTISEEEWNRIMDDVLKEMENYTQTTPPAWTNYGPTETTRQDTSTTSGCGCKENREEALKRIKQEKDKTLQVFNKYLVPGAVVFTIDQFTKEWAENHGVHILSIDQNKKGDRVRLTTDVLTAPVCYIDFAIPILHFFPEVKYNCDLIVISNVAQDKTIRLRTHDPNTRKDEEKDFDTNLIGVSELLDQGYKVVDLNQDLRILVLSRSKSRRIFFMIRGLLSALRRALFPSYFEKRLRICKSCPFFDSKRCKICGCFIAAKARLKTEACPLGKW